MSTNILDESIYIIHGNKLNEKINAEDFNDSKTHFVCINSIEELEKYPNCLFIFDPQLLEIASFTQWSKYLWNSITISEQHLGLNTDLLLPTGFPKRETIKLLGFACQQLRIKEQYSVTNNLLSFEHKRITQLNEIGIALSKEKNLGVLLKKILHESQNLSDCDAVSLYLVDKQDEENPKLVFKLSFNDTLDFKMNEFQIPLNNNSIAGYAALNNQEVNINDAYHILDCKPFQFDSSVDEEMNYRTISILAVPITNHENQVIGVLQFINRKSQRDIKLTTPEITKQYVIPFDAGICHLLCALASQAAISIDNAVLLENINNLFEGFVQASVTAIEQRDPTTSGHSFRVADLTTSLANRMGASQNHEYRQLTYSGSEIREIRYASLLHDFGKVGVREHVLIKEKKLPENRLELLQYRFELEKERLKRKALEHELHLHHTQTPIEKINLVHQQLKLQIDKLEAHFQAILEANEPTILPDGNFTHLMSLKEFPYEELCGKAGYIISENDFLALSVKKGSLTDGERQEIQSHVVHTLKFLNQIPWTSDLNNIPNIASAHHEKLNGKGYPYGLTAENISMPSRMMTICDIYDALVAKDRPYKSALQIEKALDIIQSEARQGLLDQELVNVFIDEKVYKITTSKDYKPSMNTSEPLKQNHICNVNLHSS
ncbi:MAG: GAF domain-containing protein [Gammaproteobacteria bacterium]|nr:GAF domain-containing protein [Gammaproteobacteria bacterium]